MARSSALSTMCKSCRTSYLTQTSRTLTSTTTRFAERPPTAGQVWGVDWSSGNSNSSGNRNNNNNSTSSSIEDRLSNLLRTPKRVRSPGTLGDFGKKLDSGLKETDAHDAAQAQQERANGGRDDVDEYEPYHLNVYAHKHNMHLTFSEPSRDPILSMSAGDIGLRKSQRSSYDAAYQLASYFFRKMAEKQWRIGGKKMTTHKAKTLADVGKPMGQDRGVGIEVILRGYGPGRDAFTKALLGTEGRQIKPLVCRVTDATRLKFGGTRSPKVRRLG